VEILQRPVTGEDLFDRETLIDTLTKLQKNFALIGPRKSGKTSLMWGIRPKLEQQGILCPYIYVLFEDTDTSFLLRYVNLCLFHYIRKKGHGNITGIFEDSYETLSEQITQTIEIKPQLTKHLLKLREALLKLPDMGTLEMVLKLPAALAADEDIKFMIMIDEFQTQGLFEGAGIIYAAGSRKAFYFPASCPGFVKQCTFPVGQSQGSPNSRNVLPVGPVC
jgi:AAA+ ATPase superfamily predicted ATPase